ncbi:MAG: adenylosuccinate synthetase [Pirellulaceae bacterium]|nr:MAG: adenylosuccinate synthetase [Pirellulaceae bacterium]
MPGTSVIGLQWGDEAKGKLVDLLAGEHQIVVRYLGGANAGHTVRVGASTYTLHHIPSGILYEGVQNIIATGVVLNPKTLLEEIRQLASRGVHCEGRLWISDRAHVVFPWHLEEDRLINEAMVVGEKLGVTLRGIGPCYRDKVGRTMAVRLGDLYRPALRERIVEIARVKSRMLSGWAGRPVELDGDRIYEEYRGYAEQLAPFVRDTNAFLLDAVEQDCRILYEGAQGALLDVDHGTFPFVTGSNSSGVGVSAGAGVPARWIHKTYGVVKAYSTRVGGGPFPTELENELGQLIRERGREYGTTTGRPRRCGWLDVVAVRYTARLSGVDVLAVMMLDVLSALDELKICVAYELDGRRLEHFPSHVDDLRRVQPVYETVPGWRCEISDVRSYEALPLEARRYLERISQWVGRPIALVSVGPERNQTIFLENGQSGHAQPASSRCTA